MSTSEWAAIALTLKLAAISTLILLLLCIPLGWWLSRTRSRFKPMIEAGATLPLVLPPTVLGFYLLVAFGPHGPIGQLTAWLGWPGLAFTFQGLIIASVLYSLPFVLQPLIVSFNAVRREEIETAMVLGANRWQRLSRVILPSCRSGVLAAASMGFAHTVGEFGVVLMIGGNIEGETRSYPSRCITMWSRRTMPAPTGSACCWCCSPFPRWRWCIASMRASDAMTAEREAPPHPGSGLRRSACSNC